MKKIYLLKFALWLYETHIQEDWDDFTKIGKIVCYGPWFVRAMLIWLTSPFWMISYNFTQSKHYALYKEMGEAMTMEQLRIINQLQTGEFLQRRALRQNFKGKKK